MLIKCLPVGNLEANCYIVTDEKTLSCAVIDPGDESNTVLEYIESNNLKAEVILLTHGHFDHTGAAETVAEETGAVIWINAADVSEQKELYRYYAPEGTKYYSDGDVVTVGNLSFHVMETPGHSEGSVTLRCEDALFTGDTLFADSCGRTDLPGGDMQKLLESVRRLADIPGNLEVWPGHMDPTTLDRERNGNYYIRYASEK